MKHSITAVLVLLALPTSTHAEVASAPETEATDEAPPPPEPTASEETQASVEVQAPVATPLPTGLPGSALDVAFVRGVGGLTTGGRLEAGRSLVLPLGGCIRLIAGSAVGIALCGPAQARVERQGDTLTFIVASGRGLLFSDDRGATLEVAGHRVGVDANDLDHPIVATWPEEVPEEVPETVTMEFEVPAGEARAVSLDLIVIDESGTAFTYVVPAPGSAPPTTDIAAGQETPMELELTELAQGTVEAALAPSVPGASVSWVDDRAGAVLPPVPATEGRASVELSVGRIYWPRVVLEDGAEQLTYDRHQTECVPTNV